MPATASRPPSVERLLTAARSRIGARSHEAVVAAAREIVAAERALLTQGQAARELDELAAALVDRLEGFERLEGVGLVSAINATGVILHTNLGRAPWPAVAVEAAAAASRGYSLLELERSSGRRGRRFQAVEDHLVALSGAEDALVANNNAAALALAVGLAGKSGVAVSRGELLEIGGGVRIPEVVRRAGARLVEVGTTNRTRLMDFAEVLADGRARLVLRVHPSNFSQAGFVEAPEPAELAGLAHEHGALVVDDLGSGALLDTATFGLAHEPTPSERLAAGADLVTFSGDKLVGGPQAGLIVGRRELVARLRRDPLARAVRPDKATLAALAATLGLYRAGRAAAEIPVWRMIAASTDGLRARVAALRDAVGDARVGVRAVESTLGGGSLPGEVLPSWALTIRVRSPDALLGGLRSAEPAVIGRIDGGLVVLDLRTVEPSDDERLGGAVRGVLSGGPR